MKEKSVKLNAVLNIIKSLLSVIFPLITYPYATRVLGVENLGKVNYGLSIVSYFSLIAVFGITTYAIREGSKVRNDSKQFQSLASELFSVNIVTTIFSYLLLFVLLSVSIKLESYRLLILLQSLSIIFTTLGVDWINTIYEDYLYVTIRGILTHVLSLIALFAFVKTKEDYYIYALLTVGTNAVICILNFFYCRRYTSLRITFHAKWSQHLKKMSVFFANAVAMSIYVSADTTMLGWMKGDYYVGIYSVSVKIYSIMKLILSAIYSVTIPRLSMYYAKKETDQYFSLITDVVSFILVILLPMAAGICMFSKEAVYIIAGEEFMNGAGTLSILSIALVFAILGGLMTQCVNVPAGREKGNATATIISAVENVILNVPFIMLLNHNGAAITTVLSEATVFVFCAWKSKDLLREIINKRTKKNIMHSAVGVVIVICVSLGIHMTGLREWIAMLLGVVSTLMLYTAFLTIAKNEMAMIAIKSIKTKMSRRL